MSTTFLKNISYLATFDDGYGEVGREMTDGGVLIRDNMIVAVGPMSEFADVVADRVLDLSDHVVMPGMINTHHHFYQNLTRVMVQDDELFVWLKTLYPIWAKLDDRAMETASRMAMAELIISGCTTSSDHQYIMPNDCTLDTPIRVAQEMGLRFHAARGAMSRGESKGGLPPDSCVEEEEAILMDAERLIHRYHDMSDYAMTRIVLAPCSAFSVTQGLMKDAARLARMHPGVRLHSHIAEVLSEEEYCIATYGMRSVAYAESCDWLGPDVWFAHAIFLNDAEIKTFAETGTGATFCPSAHMRCGLGIMRAREKLDAGVTVGLGVDGSASNDTSNMFMEARMAQYLQRVAPDRYLSEAPGGRGGFGGTPGALSAREALWMATRAGAKLLGRDDIGQLAPGKSADLIAIKRTRLGLAGTQRDPLAALVMCGPFEVDHSFINGVQIIDQGAFTRLDVAAALADHAATMDRIYA
ncbi:MAG: 8-oxoguanine deaminase [Alphaproteobacteria bacterium]|nr:8-oxoguanine deaminase [Alphaproteobacteria bacterium]MBU1280357.1 8-oxoguanine deaminase [Alphaproteobacteria bacterium]MBU1573938.1 8-oxoguanine deaminase [Alphaproteobacteria bacterium]MBU1829038.1 8-oxoguanine deaminase [Alphaproteobacteria bacterium]MBU2079465.1 8-oxoguanine deaminase [Alphaproteobacteria bacterium]